MYKKHFYQKGDIICLHSYNVPFLYVIAKCVRRFLSFTVSFLHKLPGTREFLRSKSTYSSPCLFPFFRNTSYELSGNTYTHCTRFHILCRHSKKKPCEDYDIESVCIAVVN